MAEFRPANSKPTENNAESRTNLISNIFRRRPFSFTSTIWNACRWRSENRGREFRIWYKIIWISRENCCHFGVLGYLDDMPSVGIMNRVFSKVRNLDAYPKVNEDFYSRTLSGGVITLASSFAMLFLIFSEFGKIPLYYSVWFAVCL